MKRFFTPLFSLLLILGISSCCCSKKNKKNQPTFQISGMMTETRSYCGGAAPTEEVLKRCNTPIGIAFGKLFVKKGITNENEIILDTIVADGNGNFSINLPAGNYCIVEDWKSKSYLLPADNANQKYDSACYHKRYQTCDYQLTVIDKNINNIKINFHRSCNWNQPCIEYHGPLPPMSHPNPPNNKVGE